MTARVLGVAQEVLNPGKWVTSNAAKILLGLTGGTEFYQAADANKWDRKEIKRDDCKPQTLFRYKDLKAYANKAGIKIGSYMRGWLEMIVWVDSLTLMPTMAEKIEHVKAPYTLYSLKGLIDTRCYRGLDSFEEEASNG